jgi:hypothetical protein
METKALLMPTTAWSAKIYSNGWREPTDLTADARRAGEADHVDERLLNERRASVRRSW